jgi:inner membrane protein
LLVADAAGHWLERRGVRVTSRARRALSVLGVVAAEFPDSDLLYSGPVLRMGPLGYLLHHRGHTHTIVWAVISAVVLWVVARVWVYRGENRVRGASGDDASSVGAGVKSAHVSRALLVVALIGTLSHLLLDYTNSYGVHPFWPLDNRWYYGDAVFIVEPWLWLVSIPALFWNRPSRVGRVVLSLGFALILAATLLLGEVARDVALMLVLFAAAWPLLQWRLSALGRTASGLGAWALVTAGFFAASGRADAAVRAAVEGGAAKERVLDVSLNPGPGDWGCWSAVVMSTDGTNYRVSTAFAAPFAGVRPLATCEARYRTGRIGSDVLGGLSARRAATFAATTQVAWRSAWSAPRETLQTLARTRCEVQAALRFMRAPVWQRVSDRELLLSDARFGVGGGGFSEVLVPVRGECGMEGAWIPTWRPPRLDVMSDERGRSERSE